MSGTTTWIKPATCEQPKTVVIESSKAQKYEADWQGKKSTRYRIKCQNDIMLDTTGMFVAKMIEAGAKDGDTMTFNTYRTDNGRPDYKISVQSNGMPITKQNIENVFGKEPNDNYANNNNDTLEAKLNALTTRVTALEAIIKRIPKEGESYDDGIPF